VIRYAIPRRIFIPNFEPSSSLAGPEIFDVIVEDPSISLCLLGSLKIAKIVEGLAAISILAALISGWPVSKISDRIGFTFTRKPYFNSVTDIRFMRERGK
jgi:hypothetical protein